LPGEFLLWMQQWWMKLWLQEKGILSWSEGQLAEVTE
jgi:hypothetical protein